MLLKPFYSFEILYILFKLRKEPYRLMHKIMLWSWLFKLYLTHKWYLLYTLGVVLTTKDVSLFYLQLRNDIHCLSTSFSLDAIPVRKEKGYLEQYKECRNVSVYRRHDVFFPLAVTSQRNAKWKCWSQRKQSCQNNHDSLLGCPLMFFTLVHFLAIKTCLKNVSE